MRQHVGIVVGSTRRLAWRVAGVTSLLLGLIGIAVPLLPTTVFLLLAAFCFDRGSERLHTWLLQHPRLGPPIREWREHGAISRKAKVLAALAMFCAMGAAVYADAPREALIAQAGILAIVAAFVISRPEPPSPPHTTRGESLPAQRRRSVSAV